LNINKRIISTKKLTESQSELLLSAGVSMVHYDLLKVEKFDVDLTRELLDHVIVTSSNSIQIATLYKKQINKLYVVGSKTANRLESLGFQIELIKENARELAYHIIQDYNQFEFTYLCGVHRRDELPQALLSTQISFTEVKVYDSIAVEKSFDCIFDAVMFFSPRGVHAFAKANPQNINLAICIGETTATAARSYTQNVKVANKATVENTIVTAVKALLND